MVIFPFVTFYNEFEQNSSLRRGHVSKNLKKMKRRAMQRSGSKAFQEEATVSKGPGTETARSPVWLGKTGVGGGVMSVETEWGKSYRALGFYAD